MATAGATIDDAAIMAAIEHLPDPEIPVLTLNDLGIIRGIAHDPTRVLISPTYTGCPATVAIESSIREALDHAGLRDVHIERVLFPPWTTDWITPEGRRKLAAVGIAPPPEARASGAPRRGPVPLTLGRAPSARCPRCGSPDTRLTAQFSATACKSLHRCNACGEPFEAVKPI